MGKRFQLLKFSRVIPSFQSCRSKDPNSHPVPNPSFHRLVSSLNPSASLPLPPVPPDTSTKPRHSSSSIKRHVSSAITSIGCGCASISTASAQPPTRHELRWEEEEKWHVAVANNNNNIIINEETTRRNNISPAPSEDAKKKKKKRSAMSKRCVKRKNKRTTSSSRARIQISASSDEGGLEYEYEGEEEPETPLVSSCRSFSTDDDDVEYSSPPESLKLKPHLKRRKEKVGRRKKAGGGGGESWLVGSPARLSRFEQWVMPCRVEGKVKESYAVVKRSEDPREDFKRSMEEMIREKEMFEEKDLEQLLHCFLSLNSREHHPVIVQAFSEIWDHLI